jgi:SAM-dependent methyltransferase
MRQLCRGLKRSAACLGSSPAMQRTLDSVARDAYEALAPAYDALTADYAHGPWLARIVELARAHGLRGRRAVDLACGTGRSSEPLLDLGFSLTAVDGSPAMARLAEDRLGPGADVHVADLRLLPALGPYDLATCLCDSVNYLTEEDDLAAAFAGIAELLVPGGMLAFDVNTLVNHREGFSESWDVEVGGAHVTWRGEGPPDLEPGGLTHAVVEVSRPGRPIASGVHLQRNWPLETLAGHLAAAGLPLVAVRGQWPGAVFDLEADESRHPKLLLLARREGGAS